MINVSIKKYADLGAPVIGWANGDGDVYVVGIRVATTCGER
jgi:hypothetical protein